MKRTTAAGGLAAAASLARIKRPPAGVRAETSWAGSVWSAAYCGWVRTVVMRSVRYAFASAGAGIARP